MLRNQFHLHFTYQSEKEPVYPDKLTRILQNGAPSLEVQLKHAWNPNDCPKDISVKTDNPLTFHRNPIAESTHGIRGKQGSVVNSTYGKSIGQGTKGEQLQ
ncbi:hypothetical protein GCK72_019619 [Caenorhabditis remanei]|uniref:Uncharacterized protein n=1 Tax=Caenorhabditis remanei TaxID=31234 RepID=A0A6A5GEG6_CAERE|nr:hypothetical protein GCK72_019619 [Caenorhabditis remanei]KAF1753063.1 hypothetical protein GCK72_019619 [Caenorhabditis remanei]